MSAIPPKADIRRRGVDVRFVPKADICVCVQQISTLFDHLVGAGKQRGGHLYSKCLCSLNVDGKLESA
jgi:hypothetical protein